VPCSCARAAVIAAAAAAAATPWGPPPPLSMMASLPHAGQVGEVGAAVVAGGGQVAALVLVQVIRAADVQHAQEAVKVDLVRICTGGSQTGREHKKPSMSSTRATKLSYVVHASKRLVSCSSDTLCPSCCCGSHMSG